MVYLDGEGSIASYAKNELNEILRCKGSENIFILFDGDINGDTILYHVHNGSWSVVNGIFESSELDMGDEKTLHNFVEYVFARYPSDHYLLEIWGHGNGWMGVCFDKTNGDMLTLSEICDAIDKKIDIIMFSACYMGGIEVGYEMSFVADYMVACEGALPASSVPHAAIFEKINEESSPEQVCRIIVDEYKENMGYLSSSFAAWNLSEMKGMVEKINEFVAILENFDRGKLFSSRNSSSISLNYIDLYKFAEQIHECCGEDAGIMQEINKTVISCYGMMKGIGIYFPLPSIFSASYKNVDFSLHGIWDNFLEGL